MQFLILFSSTEHGGRYDTLWWMVRISWAVLDHTYSRSNRAGDTSTYLATCNGSCVRLFCVSSSTVYPWL
jgi:hypothetical protein